MLYPLWTSSTQLRSMPLRSCSVELRDAVEDRAGCSTCYFQESVLSDGVCSESPLFLLTSAPQSAFNSLVPPHQLVPPTFAIMYHDDDDMMNQVEEDSPWMDDEPYHAPVASSSSSSASAHARKVDQVAEQEWEKLSVRYSDVGRALPLCLQLLCSPCWFTNRLVTVMASPPANNLACKQASTKVSTSPLLPLDNSAPCVE